MIHDEIKGLIDVCVTAYRQDAGSRDEMVWIATLGDLPFGHTRTAVLEWIKTSPYWPKPADIRDRARLIAAQEDRDRAKRQQIDGRRQAIESAIQTHAASQRTGANMIRHVLGRLKDAGQDAANGKLLGVERATAVCEEAIKEWLDRTKEDAL